MLVIALLALAVVAAGIVMFIRPRVSNLSSRVVSVSSEIIAEPVKEILPANKPEETQLYYYPISNYASRLEERKYGQYFDSNTKVNAACGKPFTGYHTGDDLETGEAELETDVPIKAIAAGKIIQKGNVGGYGGLVTQETKLSDTYGQVTVYYGHLDLGSVKKTEGDMLEAGEVIGFLGDECSAETDFARKHLHFAIRKGDGSDVRGYVPTSGTLSSWLNPSMVLSSLEAE
jgi:murein DD-endopeptidase MepM/ murein hydrolase activator NlpD